MKLTEERKLGLSQEIDTFLAKGMIYDEVVATFVEHGYSKDEIEDLVVTRISLRAAHQPFLLKKTEASPNFDALHKLVEKPSRSLKMSVWEVLGGVGSAIVLILMALLSVWYGMETGNYLAFVFALGLGVAAFLNMTSNYRGMW